MVVAPVVMVLAVVALALVLLVVARWVVGAVGGRAAATCTLTVVLTVAVPSVMLTLKVS